MVFKPSHFYREGFFYGQILVHWIMKKILSLVLIITFLASISAMTQPTELVEISRIAIPEEIFLSSFLEVDIQDDRILITDTSIGQVVLFDGIEWKVLDSEICHPGFSFQPLQAKFGDHDELFITNSGIWGFRFKKNGDCIGAAEKGTKFFTPEDFYYGNQVVGINADFTQRSINVWDKEGKEIETLFSITNEFPNAEYRFKGRIFEDKSIIYFIKSLEPIIYAFNRETKELANKEFNSNLFKPIKSDIPGDINNPNFFEEIGRIIKNYSMIYGLYQLNESSGVVLFNQHVDEKSVTVGLVFNLSDLSVKETLVFERLPDFISNNEFVFIERENDGYENEVIEIVFKRVKRN